MVVRTTRSGAQPIVGDPSSQVRTLFLLIKSVVDTGRWRPLRPSTPSDTVSGLEEFDSILDFLTPVRNGSGSNPTHELKMSDPFGFSSSSDPTFSVFRHDRGSVHCVQGGSGMETRERVSVGCVVGKRSPQTKRRSGDLTKRIR